MSSPLQAQVQRRRTFAIISNPDAGKTTLKEPDWVKARDLLPGRQGCCAQRKPG